MNAKKKKYVVRIVLVLIFIIIQARGYYVRNLKVDSEFLNVITDKVILLENKRIDNINHTREDYIQLHSDLNTGHMANKSNMEMDISSKVSKMSIFLREYYDAEKEGNKSKTEHSLDNYYQSFNELEEILAGLRGGRNEIEILWEKGIFKTDEN